MRNLALLLLTVVFLGFAGVYIARDSGGEAPADALALDRGVEKTATQAEAGGILREVASPKSTPSEAQKSDRSEVVQAAPEADPVTEEAEASLSGRVVNERGAAIAGAHVRLSRSGFLEQGAFATIRNDFDLPEQEAVLTDNAGRFELKSDQRGTLFFDVGRKGFAPLRASREVSEGQVGTLEDFVLEQGVRLSGHVVDAGGTGLPKVSIYKTAVQSGGFTIRTMGGAETPLAVTGPGGAFEIDELEAGPFALQLRHAGHPDSEEEGTVKRPGDSLTGLRYVLEEGFRIAGIVSELEPGEHSEYQVRAMPNHEDEGGDNTMERFENTRFASIDSSGQFELLGLREGVYGLQLIESEEGMPLFSNAHSSTVQARTGDADVELALRAPMGITFRVVDANSGQACTAYNASVGNSWFRPAGFGMQGTDEHEDGITTIESVDVQGSSSKTDLRISAEGYSPLSLEDVVLMPGVVKDLGELRLDPVPMITVEVLDESTGKPIKGARVRLSEMPMQVAGGERRMAFSFGSDSDEGVGSEVSRILGGQANRSKTDSAGIAAVASMPGKRCKLAVTHRSYAGEQLLDLDLPNTGDASYVVRMSKGGTVTVTVLDANGEPAAGVRVRENLVEDDAAPVVIGGNGGRKTKDNGEVTFKHLSPGTHRFTLAGESGPGMFMSSGDTMIIAGGPGGETDEGEDLFVTEGSELAVTLHKKADGNVEGVVSESGEPLAGAMVSFAEKTSSPNPMSHMMGFGGGNEARTNGAGEFTREGLKVGTYTVTINHPDRIMAMEFELRVSAGRNKASYDLPVAILEGRVTDTDGNAVAGVEVRPKRYESSPAAAPTRMVVTMVTNGSGGGAVSMSTGEGAESARTDDNGHYSLRGVLSDVELVVECTSDKYQKAESKPVKVAANQTRRHVDLDLVQAGGVLITVLTADGEPGEYCLVTLDYADDVDPMPDQAREFTGSGGATTAQGLRPGYWSVSARTVPMGGPGGQGGDTHTTETAEVEVIAGEIANLTLNLD